MNRTMLATRFVRSISAKAPFTSTRSFSLVLPRLAAGDTGSPRSGGSAQGDSFSRREEASENLYIKQQEAEKLKLLREKIRKQKEDLSKDEAAAKEMEDKGQSPQNPQSPQSP